MRLLLAEDEQALARALTAILKHGNYTVDTVYDGEQALQSLLTGQYDGAVLDIMMPKLDGLEVLRQVRDRGVPLPILLLTAKSGLQDKITGLDSGANDYLTKPFAAGELLARVRAMTRTQEAPEPLRLGNVTLDRATLTLLTPSGSIGLCQQESLLLELLLCSAGHLVTNARLCERIWGGQASHEAVWVYISYLRKKLTALHADVEIQPVEKEGYRLEALPC